MRCGTFELYLNYSTLFKSQLGQAALVLATAAAGRKTQRFRIYFTARNFSHKMSTKS